MYIKLILICNKLSLDWYASQIQHKYLEDLFALFFALFSF